jgi:alkylation response protein AidB-like acyl-CoA dehydrogenase
MKVVDMPTASPSEPQSNPRTSSPPELDAVRRFAPEIADRSREFEALRRLPADLAARLAEAGLFRMSIAEAYGGAERHPLEVVRVIEEVSRADGSVGWCVMIGQTMALLSGVMPEGSARLIYGNDRNVITGGATAPTGKAVARNGGYVVDGRWQWGSGTQNCQWICGVTIVLEEGRPRQTAGGEPEMRLMIFPAREVEILDTWDASGLGGSGSHDFQVRQVFVPAERALIWPVGTPTIERPLYYFPFFGMFAVCVCSVSLGIARRALDEFVALAGTKTAAWERRPLSQQARVQIAVAEAEVALRSARALLFETVESAWEVASALKPPSTALRRDLRLAAANVAWQAVKAVELVYHAAGGSAVHSSNPLQRCFRDVNVVTQHIMVNSAMYETTGRLFLNEGPISPTL